LNTLLDEPAEVAALPAPSRRVLKCAACDRPIVTAHGLLCIDCGAKAPRPLVLAYQRARDAAESARERRSADRAEAERALEVATARLVAGVRGEPLPHDEPSPSAEPPRVELPRSILPPPEDRVMAVTKKIRAQCHVCLMEFEYTPKNPKFPGRKRTTCDACEAKHTAKEEGSAKRLSSSRSVSSSTSVSKTGKQNGDRATDRRTESPKSPVLLTRPRRTNPAPSRYADVRAELQARLEQLDAERAKVVAVIESLDALESGE